MTCETCRYWEPVGPEEAPRTGDGTWGRCRMIGQDEGHEPSTGFESVRAFTSDAEGFQSWLSTRSDFGCVEYVNRTP